MNRSFKSSAGPRKGWEYGYNGRDEECIRIWAGNLSGI
jgi:hypothetical protein